MEMQCKEIAGKITIHTDKKYSRRHNLREYDVNKWNTDNHIDYERTKMNVVLEDKKELQFFDEIFGDDLMQYNQREEKRHKERVIGSATDRKKAVSTYFQEQKKNIQEAIVQMSDHENYILMCERVGQQQADEMHIEFLKSVYEDWKKNNPNLKILSAVIHMDEVKDGTPHLHLDFLPVSNSDRGLKTKVSMDGALKSQGYERKKDEKYAETCYKRWLRDERERIETLGNNYITVIPHETAKEKHQQPSEFKKEKKIVDKVKKVWQDYKDGKRDKKTIEILINNYNALNKIMREELEKEKADFRAFTKEQKAKYEKAFEELKENYEKANSVIALRKDVIEREKSVKKREDEVLKREVNVRMREYDEDLIVEKRVQEELSRNREFAELQRVSEEYKRREKALLWEEYNNESENVAEYKNTRTKSKKINEQERF